jgi:hypothetical protein
MLIMETFNVQRTRILTINLRDAAFSLSSTGGEGRGEEVVAGSVSVGS